jgi:hypothetical protein
MGQRQTLVRSISFRYSNAGRRRTLPMDHQDDFTDHGIDIGDSLEDQSAHDGLLEQRVSMSGRNARLPGIPDLSGLRVVDRHLQVIELPRA